MKIGSELSQPRRNYKRSSNAERQKEFSKRATEAGRKRLCVWIDQETQEALNAICERADETQANVVSLLILQAVNIMREHDT